MEWSVKIDPHRLTPNVRWLFRDDPLARRADAMVADKDLDRPQSLLGLRNRVRTALRTSEIRNRILEPDICQILPASGDAHDFGAA
jgi:hypothetical protein